MPRPALKVVIPFLVWMVHLESNVLAADRCADSGNDGFVCTRDILLLRERLDGRSVDMGVDQRIDGSEAEKQQIRDVLQEMEDYFLSEVLGMPEYEHVRPHCKNNNELCAFWASVGECESNRVFMLSNCAASCRFCLLLHSGLV